MTPTAALRHAWLRRRLPRPPNEKGEQGAGAARATPTGPRTPKINTLMTGSGNKVRVQLNDDRSATLHPSSGKLPPVT